MVLELIFMQELRMRYVHEYTFKFQISPEESLLLHEAWIDFARKKEPSKQDRSRKITYSVPNVGTVVINHSNGTCLLYTKKPEKAFTELSKWLGHRSKILLQETLVLLPRVGIHIPYSRKAIVTRTYLGAIPITVTVKRCRHYYDIHISTEEECGVFPILSSKEAETSSIPSKIKRIVQTSLRDYLKYNYKVKDEEIINFAIKNQVIIPSKDYGRLGFSSRSWLWERCEKLVRLGVFEKVSRRPAIYVPILREERTITVKSEQE